MPTEAASLLEGNSEGFLFSRRSFSHLILLCPRTTTASTSMADTDACPPNSHSQPPFVCLPPAEEIVSSLSRGKDPVLAMRYMRDSAGGLLGKTFLLIQITQGESLCSILIPSLLILDVVVCNDAWS